MKTSECEGTPVWAQWSNLDLMGLSAKEVYEGSSLLQHNDAKRQVNRLGTYQEYTASCGGKKPPS